MKIVLIDNGSVEPAAHESLRAAAAAVGSGAEVPVFAVSWKHSDRIPHETLAEGRLAGLGALEEGAAASGRAGHDPARESALREAAHE